ncbi:Hypothetical predicted protein [Marmota monax]|uniref:Uncharacterized protein n=1 Tax=Marmota monax TaxID=9995 RepID=A0A5E4BM91_MARMO|nr:Hypothetical predicted protein [Marmota monax]
MRTRAGMETGDKWEDQNTNPRRDLRCQKSLRPFSHAYSGGRKKWSPNLEPESSLRHIAQAKNKILLIPFRKEAALKN